LPSISNHDTLVTNSFVGHNFSKTEFNYFCFNQTQSVCFSSKSLKRVDTSRFLNAAVSHILSF
jgi:hypothetical protein